MSSDRRPPPPLDRAALDRLALRYVERFATTRGRLAAYLARKIRERGFDGTPPDPATIADRFAQLGYVNDRLYAEAKAAAMARRGLGARRVGAALRHAGIGGEDAQAVAPQIDARTMQTALDFARRRRIGPFAVEPADRDRIAKQVAAMVRAGHGPALAWRIARMEPGETLDEEIDARTVADPWLDER